MWDSQGSQLMPHHHSSLSLNQRRVGRPAHQTGPQAAQGASQAQSPRSGHLGREKPAKRNESPSRQQPQPAKRRAPQPQRVTEPKRGAGSGIKLNWWLVLFVVWLLWRFLRG
ncbi:hypothetical protein [Lacticaseibacillus nasuensis]|uniref:hypothetical protein n=1 Tax=Lacticaseibacillus nasuensis TaxID=944671 RepID=UPI00138F1A2B|nr:hypothetical protein [Lacticaseibacillus nasuensis]